jgi:hypothetical protein
MQLRALAALLICCLLVEQTAMAAGAQVPSPPPETGSSSTAAAQTITVLPGTVVPLTLLSPIKSKSTKVGDSVRAVVAFPITAGSQVAIPAGTYVEGVVTSVTAQAKKTRQPDVQIHFTRLLYANGYTATLDAVNTQARNEIPGVASPAIVSDAAGASGDGAGRTRIAFYGGEGFAAPAQTTQPTLPTLPPLPNTGRNVLIGLMAGTGALLLVGILVGLHHKNNADYLMFDAGWQFQMAISTPLTVDAGQVAAAAATPLH